MSFSTKKIYLLLAVLIVVWALNWPLLKIGLQDMPPLWLGVVRLFLGAVVMFALALMQKQFALPCRQDLPLLFSIGVIQMGGFVALVNYGLLFVSPGRSAILAYSTPLWVTPLAVLFFGEKLTPLKLLGVVLGIGGVLVLFSPYTLDWSDHSLLHGNGALLLAAICWAVAMLHTRYGRWHTPAGALLPWQLLLGSLCILPLALLLEPLRAIHWTPQLGWIIIYNVLLGTAFGYWSVIIVSQRLAVTTTSLSLLLVPVLGLVFSAFMVSEPITTGILVAMLLISGGLACVAVANRPRNSF